MNQAQAGALRDQALSRLREGLPPGDPELLEALTVGREAVVGFWTSQYLEDYVPAGGSKVKFLVGKAGSGKTHALLLLRGAAVRLGYLAVLLDAHQVRLNRFETIYQAVLDSVDIAELVARYAAIVIEDLGYRAVEVPAGQDFVTWAKESEGRVPEILARDINKKLEPLLRDRRLNQNFAAAFMQLCTDHLGSRRLEPEQKETLLQWLQGRQVAARDLRRLQVFARIDRFNARPMLASLLDVARRCGYRGLFVGVDGLEALLQRGPEGRWIYGRAARNEVYESLRQLIDDIAGFAGAFFVFATRPEIIHDRNGFEAYEALYMRIQNEISASRPNKFADLLNLDGVVREFFNTEAVAELERLMREVFGPPPEKVEVDWEAELEAVGMTSALRRAVMALAGAYPQGGGEVGPVSG